MLKNQKGFTLIEVLVVVGLFAVVAGLVVLTGIHSHSGFTAKDDEDLAIAALQKARSQSMHGVCLGANCTAALTHGVHASTHGLTLFQGTLYDPADNTNEYIEAQSNATAFSGADIIFAPLSGNTDATGTLFILDNGTSMAMLTVGAKGQILWNR